MNKQNDNLADMEIGFTIDDSYYDKDGVRHITKINLEEISIQATVTFDENDETKKKSSEKN